MENVFSFLVLLQAVEGILDENAERRAAWKDWADWSGRWGSIYPQLGEDEISVLENAVKSNGKTLAADLLRKEAEIWGKNFAGSVTDQICKKI